MLRHYVPPLYIFLPPFKRHAYIQHFSTSYISYIHFIFLRCQETVTSVFKGSVIITVDSVSTDRCLLVPHIICMHISFSCSRRAVSSRTYILCRHPGQ